MDCILAPFVCWFKMFVFILYFVLFPHLWVDRWYSLVSLIVGISVYSQLVVISDFSQATQAASYFREICCQLFYISMLPLGEQRQILVSTIAYLAFF
jgi:hypothetical protein